MSGQGVVCYISNSSWVKEPSYVVLRRRLLGSFDRFYLENMHGNRKISEYAPDGRTSETIFAIPGFLPGIKQGTAISLWVKTGGSSETSVLYRNDFNAARAMERRAQLLASLVDPERIQHYHPVNPTRTNRFSFRPLQIAPHYLEWPKVVDLCQIAPFNGPVERRGHALISMEKHLLESRIKAYFDKTVSDPEIELIYPSLMMTGNRIVGPEARKKIILEHRYDENRIVRYPFKPFDIRWCYLDNIRPLFSEPSPQLLEQRFAGNSFLLHEIVLISQKKVSLFSFHIMSVTMIVYLDIHAIFQYLLFLQRIEPSQHKIS